MIRFHVEEAGLIGPALTNWNTALSILAANEGYAPGPLPPLSLNFLPANERRRLTPHLRLALAVAAETMAPRAHTASAAPAETPAATVFAHSEGDLGIVDHICSALTRPERPVSPTHFHNSVHNTPAAYWHQALGWHGASTSLAAGDASFAAGLVEAATQLTPSGREARVLLVASEAEPPVALSGLCPCATSFACGLLLAADASPASRWEIRLELNSDEEPCSTMADEALEALSLSNPAARALPLLAAMASGRRRRVVLPGVDEATLALDVFPISRRESPR